MYHIANTECTECIWWKGKIVPVTTLAEVLSNCLHGLLPKLHDFRPSVDAILSVMPVLRELQYMELKERGTDL